MQEGLALAWNGKPSNDDCNVAPATLYTRFILETFQTGYPVNSYIYFTPEWEAAIRDECIDKARGVDNALYVMHGGSDCYVATAACGYAVVTYDSPPHGTCVLGGGVLPASVTPSAVNGSTFQNGTNGTLWPGYFPSSRYSNTTEAMANWLPFLESEAPTSHNLNPLNKDAHVEEDGTGLTDLQGVEDGIGEI